MAIAEIQQLAGLPAQLVTFSSQTPADGELKTLEVWTVKNSRVYIVSYRAQPQQYYRFLQAATIAINSFAVS